MPVCAQMNTLAFVANMVSKKITYFIIVHDTTETVGRGVRLQSIM